MKKAVEVMEILEAFDLAGTLRGAAQLAGCDHKTVGHWVRVRDVAGGGLALAVRARPTVDPFAGKIEEWVDRSHGKIRADHAHEKLLLMGYQGSERTTRRALSAAKRAWRAEHGRRTRPWVTEPGLWLQWDYGDGPDVDGHSTSLFCAWLAWSRYRVVLALRDRTMASVVMGLDRAFRAIGGVPTYALTDNEKTVSVDHVCGIAVRNPVIVAVARHYGVSIKTCVPADPQSKGGSEATVRIAKADLVATDHNLRAGYDSFAELELACEAFCERVNTRSHRVTGQPPVVMLEQERERLHPLPAVAHTLCFGQTRKVGWQSTISVGGALYSVPSQLIDQRVWARVDDQQLVVVHGDHPGGPREVARHQLTTPGRPSLQDEHYPPRPAGALERRPRAGSEDEATFLAIGPGAECWLTAAAAAGTSRLRRKTIEAIDLSKLHGQQAVNDALQACARAARFADGDLAAILAYQQQQQDRGGEVIAFPERGESGSLARSTQLWQGLGR